VPEALGDGDQQNLLGRIRGVNGDVGGGAQESDGEEETEIGWCFHGS
jgi:hypothetical protein